MRFIATFVYGAVSTFCLLASCRPAHANPHITVHVDLRTDAGVKRTFDEIAMAAENICPYHGDRYLKHVEIFQRCRREAIESAVYRIADVRLAEYASTHR